MIGNGTTGAWAQLLQNQKGIAAVEFALIMPVLMLSYLGATDVTQGWPLIASSVRSSSQYRILWPRKIRLPAIRCTTFFDSGIAIMRPFDFESTKLRLTIVEVDGNSTQATGATARNWEIEVSNGQAYELPSDMLSLFGQRYVVIAEASYDYAPMFGTVFNGTVSLGQRSLHLTHKDVDNFGFPPDALP
jgi:Flp pilus assembly pilin Flp